MLMSDLIPMLKSKAFDLGIHGDGNLILIHNKNLRRGKWLSCLFCVSWIFLHCKLWVYLSNKVMVSSFAQIAMALKYRDKGKDVFVKECTK